MTSGSESGLSNLEYHVLLALAGGAQHGYAVRDAVEMESGGTLTPRAGTLYRVIARLLDGGLAHEVPPPADAPPHPGLPRRYYALSGAGRGTLAEEARRLRQAAALAEERLSPGRP